MGNHKVNNGKGEMCDSQRLLWQPNLKEGERTNGSWSENMAQHGVVRPSICFAYRRLQTHPLKSLKVDSTRLSGPISSSSSSNFKR